MKKGTSITMNNPRKNEKKNEKTRIKNSCAKQREKNTKEV